MRADRLGKSLGSGFFYYYIERARKSGVAYVVQAGDSIRDDHVIETCDKYNVAMPLMGIRLFHH